MLSILINPFKKYRENQLLFIGTLITIIASYLAYLLYARFDGVLDMHLVPHIQIWQPLSDNLVNIAVLTFTLFLGARMIYSKTRFIDILTVAIVARTPQYLLPFFNINGFMDGITKKIMQAFRGSGAIPKPDLTGMEIGILLFFSLFSFLVLVWYIALLFNGYKVASNAKDIKPVLVFAGCILISEILSKLIISNLP